MEKVSEETNMEDHVQLKKEEWDEFYKQQGSGYFQLESTILKSHGEDQKKLLYEIFGSTKTLVQTIGVVAGFGFTALGYVQSLSLFISGEFFLLSAIFAGLFWTQKVYKSNLASSQNESGRVKNIFAERFPYFKKVYDKALLDIASGKEISVPRAHIIELQSKNNELLQKFITQEEIGDRRDPFTILMVLFVVGGVCLLTSFVDICTFK